LLRVHIPQTTNKTTMHKPDNAATFPTINSEDSF